MKYATTRSICISNDTIPSHLKIFQYLHHPLRNT